MNACSMPRTEIIWRFLCGEILYFFLTKRKHKPYVVSAAMIPTLQMSKERLQEAKRLTQSHTVSK